jgi:hypothetical protein
MIRLTRFRKVGEIKQVIVGSNTIDASELKSSIKTRFLCNRKLVKRPKNGSAQCAIPHIKLFWLHVLTKDRWFPIILFHPKMIEIISKNTGNSGCLGLNAKKFNRRK